MSLPGGGKLEQCTCRYEKQRARENEPFWREERALRSKFNAATTTQLLKRSDANTKYFAAGNER